jgi:PKD repeat protein
MKNISKYFIYFILSVIPISYVTGQETNFASNVKSSLSLDGKQLVIEYDLSFSDTTQLFDIILKIYDNANIIQPKDNDLHGSWGNRLKPGNEKLILWDFPNEIKGNINKVTVDILAIKTKGIFVNFDYNVLSKKPPYEVKFVNKSRNVDLYSWKFGDLKSGKNNFSTLESPVHSFKSPGNYTVELTAGNSTNKTSDTITKAITMGKGLNQDLKKHKTLKTICLGSAVATAAASGFCLVKSVSLNKNWRTEADPVKQDELKKQYKTFGVIGAAALVVTSVCVTEVFIQSKKIKASEQAVSMHYIPVDKGAVLGLAWSF